MDCGAFGGVMIPSAVSLRGRQLFARSLAVSQTTPIAGLQRSGLRQHAYARAAFASVTLEGAFASTRWALALRRGLAASSSGKQPLPEAAQAAKKKAGDEGEGAGGEGGEVPATVDLSSIFKQALRGDPVMKRIEKQRRQGRLEDDFEDDDLDLDEEDEGGLLPEDVDAEEEMAAAAERRRRAYVPPPVLDEDGNPLEDLTEDEIRDLPRREQMDYMHRRACELGQDSYKDIETGDEVKTAVYHLTRGVCCEEKGCRHCPYGYVSPGVWRETHLPELFRGIELKPSTEVCLGCGSAFQCEDERQPGFLPEAKMSELPSLAAEGRMAICKRCFQLKHYGKLAQLEMNPEDFRRKLAGIRKKDCLVVKIVDIFDFQGTFLRDLSAIVGDNPVANKADLLPAGVNKERVMTWLHRCTKTMGIRVLWSIHLISSFTGDGVEQLAEDIDYATRGRDVYVIGAANVGKSTFINRLLKLAAGGTPGAKPKENFVTASAVPGTTLNLISIPLSFKRKAAAAGARKPPKGPKRPSTLFDTPGILMPHQLTRYLNTDELAVVVPRKKLRPATFRLTAGRSLFLGSMGRLDHVEGPPILATVFLSQEIVLHITSTDKADEIFQRLAGTTLTPPFSAERVAELGAMRPWEYGFEGRSWTQAEADLVYSGLGWVSLASGAGPVRVRAWAPGHVSVTERIPLMPFDVGSPEKVTGAPIMRTPKAKGKGKAPKAAAGAGAAEGPPAPKKSGGSRQKREAEERRAAKRAAAAGGPAPQP
eukprot:tig00022080_g23790.t1